MDNKSSSLSLYLQRIGDRKTLTREEERELADLIVAGGEEAGEAKKLMIECNLKLVVAIAKEHQYIGVDLDDLISEGNIGLIRAVDKFDPSLGFKLSTYASWWVKQHIHLAISEQAKMIRMPPQAIEKLRKIKKIITELSKELGRNPTMEEVAMETSIPIEKIEKVLQWGVTPLSLNQTTEDSKITLEETIEDESAKNPLVELLKKSDAQWTNNLLSALTEKEREIIKKRYGIDHNEPATLETIGEFFKVTRERIRQIELRALKKLRRKIQQLKFLHKNQ